MVMGVATFCRRCGKPMRSCVVMGLCGLCELLQDEEDKAAERNRMMEPDPPTIRNDGPPEDR